MPFTVKEKPEGLTFSIRVQPRSSRNKVAGLYGDSLKILLTAPPVDNAANNACCAYLAKICAVAKSSVEIVSGHTGRNKLVLIHCDGDRREREALKKIITSLTKP